MNNDDLPKGMDIKLSQGIQLSMLVLDMYKCMYIDSSSEDSLLNPLAEIVNQPKKDDVDVCIIIIRPIYIHISSISLVLPDY